MTVSTWPKEDTAVIVKNAPIDCLTYFEYNNMGGPMAAFNSVGCILIARISAEYSKNPSIAPPENIVLKVPEKYVFVSCMYSSVSAVHR